MQNPFLIQSLLLAFGLALAQIPAASALDGVPVPAPTPVEARAKQLSTIQRDISWLEQSVEEHRKQIANAGKEDVTDLKEELSDLELRLQKARTSFLAIASEVELPNPETESRPKKRDLIQELQAFVEPLFDAIKRISEKPRRVEGYKTSIAELNEKIAQTDKAMLNLDHAIEAKTFPTLEKELSISRGDLGHRRDELQVHLDSLTRKLDQELGDHQTVMQALTSMIQGFFSSKGRNLLISFMVFIGVFWSLHKLKHVVFRAVHTRFQEITRPLQMVYGVLAALVSIFAVLLTLHFLNDWFLVTIIVLLLVAFAWSSKAFISHFISETKLALNLGSVKQGERVVWQGVPWLVKSLGFRSVLVNEALQGGRVMLPAHALSSMLSRATVEGEPWFPTRVGDFVLLDDRNYGKVETQTPETVVLNTGNTRKHYSTAAVLSNNPQNFSQGFEISAEVMIRHSAVHPPLEKLRPLMKAAVLSKLASRLDGTPADLTGIEMVITASRPDVTRVWLKAQCRGELALHRDLLQRELHSAGGEAWREAFPS